MSNPRTTCRIAGRIGRSPAAHIGRFAAHGGIPSRKPPRGAGAAPPAASLPKASRTTCSLAAHGLPEASGRGLHACGRARRRRLIPRALAAGSAPAARPSSVAPAATQLPGSDRGHRAGRQGPSPLCATRHDSGHAATPRDFDCREQRRQVADLDRAVLQVGEDLVEAARRQPVRGQRLRCRQPSPSRPPRLAASVRGSGSRMACGRPQAAGCERRSRASSGTGRRRSHRRRNPGVPCGRRRARSRPRSRSRPAR